MQLTKEIKDLISTPLRYKKETSHRKESFKVATKANTEPKFDLPCIIT